MDLSDGPGEAALRAELRAWLHTQLPPGSDDPPAAVPERDEARASQWSAALHEAGFAGVSWPESYGGKGLPGSCQAVVVEEMTRAGAPEHRGMLGLTVVGPTLLAHGTPAQKEHYLPRILSGEVVFCLGLSESEAGSDLAMVRTRAVRDGAALVVTGHKLWSSYAHRASHCLVLARTGPARQRHRDLSCVVVPLASPGVTVRPIRQLTGEADFSEIFLTEVRVPATEMVGQAGDGWQVVMTGLACERGVLGVSLAARLEVQLRHLVATARAAGYAEDPRVRDEIGRLATEVTGLRWTSYRILQDGPAAAAVASILKLRWSLAYQRLTALALELLAGARQPAGPADRWQEYWRYHHLRSLGSTIEGGTSEIQRNVVAERLLGLPRTRPV